MNPPGPRPATIRFGPYEADMRTRELRKHGLRMQLRGKSFEVLAALLEHPGEVVTRQVLRQRLWPEGIFVDFENSLNSTVNRLRDVLGDSHAKPRFIETLPRLGYRLIVPLEPGRTAPPKLAVLPFENLNHDPEQDFFADGVADALTTALGNVGTLRVISRQSVLHLKGSKRTIPEIARRLKIDAVVEGSVLWAGGRVRITAQLVQVAPERHLWARGYECEMGDILTIQGEVARAIAEAVEVVLTPAELGRLSRPRPVDPDAHVAYLKGLHLMGRASRESFHKALDYFRLAVEKDATHALAYAQMADCYGLLGHWGYLPFLEAFHRSKEAANRALALDDTLSTAHSAFAWATWICDWDLVTSEAEYRRAVELNPSEAHAHVANSIFLVATRDDRSRAVREVRLALDLDPLSQFVNAMMAWVHVLVREYELASEQAHRTLELFPDSLQAYQALGLAEVCRSRYAEGLAALEKAVAISPDAITVAYLGCAHARAGNTDTARALLEGLRSRSEREHVPPRCFALFHVSLGEPDRAFEFLEKAYEARDSGLFFLRAMPLYEPLRGDPRFDEMLRRVGIAR